MQTILGTQCTFTLTKSASWTKIRKLLRLIVSDEQPIILQEKIWRKKYFHRWHQLNLFGWWRSCAFCWCFPSTQFHWARKTNTRLALCAFSLLFFGKSTSRQCFVAFHADNHILRLGEFFGGGCSCGSCCCCCPISGLQNDIFIVKLVQMNRGKYCIELLLYNYFCDWF